MRIGRVLADTNLLRVPLPRHIVSEDSITGIEAPRRAGMRCIGVTTTNPPEALAQADSEIDKLDQLSVEQIGSIF